MRTELLRFNGAVERAPAIDAWMRENEGELGAIAREWSGNSCMTDAQWHVWEMCPSATSMCSLRT